MRKKLVMTSAYARPAVQTIGVEVGMNDRLWGGVVRASFLDGKSHGQRCTWKAAFFWQKITLTVIGFYAQSKPV